MIIKRRQFLQTGSLATASLLLPRFLKAFERPGRMPPGNRVVVVLQMSGGNDGLNTVIPVRNDIYYRLRPHLGIGKEKAALITDEVGLHPALIGLRGLYDDGSLGILSSVGYPNPDRSHFRSMDIWQTASDSKEVLQTGWLGRYLDAQCSGCDHPTQALEIDDVVSLALKGAQIKGMALKDPKRLYNTSHEKYFSDLQAQHVNGQGGSVDYLYKTMAETLSGANYIFEQSKLRPSSASYPNTELGRNLHTIASLIFSDINTRVYYLSLGSFDTHVNQAAQQERLFTELNDALVAFVADLKANHRFEDTLLLTFSEFGRRVAQNASGGTDHGTANTMFLVSGGLKQKGLINGLPDLSDLSEGDLKYQVDFKDVYATVLNKWLGTDDKSILGRQSTYLSCI
ncbi:MAG: DUF1501 domain-containing protein [Bacteroidota bacterium]|nr:DUF1501 domain-containing protein [Bacteroidota bacterium]MDP4216170.1 DUF1501 domain-containing protein [Bacteroidota bacterium]MDP4247921.1 DUF1501 domain-containing protein [Bacteroidota bacterium]MDP4255106.1 DUF1501 domain-containing protein [Bacteroidota bacterium]MDP4258338.1 DUF1501 domain-containing protein [Bacteroidota bacterium]